MFGYRVPAPNEALIITGRRQRQDDVQFKVVVGHGTFVVPIVSRASVLDLSMQGRASRRTATPSRASPSA